MKVMIMNRRTFFKKVFGSLITFIGLGGGTYYYAHKIEPSMLKIQQENIFLHTIPPSFHKFKIIQFSDTHLGFQYDLSQLKNLVKKINELNPNIIVFTGDLLDEPQSFQHSDDLINILKRLRSTDGNYWIYGNHDHGGYGTDIVLNIMKSAHFTLLKNSHTVIERNNERIILSGIDDMILGKPNLETALQQTNIDLFTILLAHEPDFADIAKEFPIDLQLSGHSHGGQVRLPFIGHLYTPIYAEKYIAGKYMLDNLVLYVNKGIGTTRLPFRFFCKPEIHEFTLKSM